MAEFLGKNFLLDTKYAEELYHNHAAKMPIYDFHCHLSPQEIYEDKTFRSLTEVWLGGDHYKWRLIRASGISEQYITGAKTDYEKFERFAEVVPYAIGSPVYHWVHLELKRFFGIEDVLNPSTAESIYKRAGEKLKSLSARKLIAMSNVKKLCTTDDPTDTLEYHIALKKEWKECEVLPTFRPDKFINIELDTFLPFIARLEERTSSKIDSLSSLTRALTSRIEFFASVGCVVTDHALDRVEYGEATEDEVSNIFTKALNGKSLTQAEVAAYKTYILLHLSKDYARLGLAQQYHIGALRNSNTVMKNKLGADTGFDCIEDQPFALNLVKLLDAQNQTSLPKTILYCLNPRDNEVLATVINCFQSDGTERATAGKIQFGSAWWFNDQLDGMSRQMDALANLGLFSQFVGMLTDSRSFLSYPRHEYFRRLLCQKIGRWIEEGSYPESELATAAKIVENICYNNAERYFKI